MFSGTLIPKFLSMDKHDIILLLDCISKNRLIDIPLEGWRIINAVDFAVSNQLVTRTETGNFKLSERGSGLLNETMSWDNM